MEDMQYFLDHQTELPETLVPVGSPVEETEVVLLTEAGEPTEPAGKIRIRSEAAALEFWGKPELARKVLLPDPAREARKLYRTGDLDRVRPNGSLGFTGRKDGHVKLRSYRIEVREIETVLTQHPAVQEAAVLVREEVPREKSVVAYVQFHAGKESTVSKIRKFVRTKLPGYMVPSIILTIDAIPLTPNGKVDRDALPAPDQTQHNSQRIYLASRNKLELQLTKIWEKILAVRPIGLRDNFFELGGHSLLVMRLLAQIEKTLGRHFPVAAFFQAQTIEEQAKLLFCQEQQSAPLSSLVPIQPSGSQPPFFCVHAHEGQVFYFRHLASCLGPDQPFYGLQAQGLDGKQPYHTRVEDMAAHYIQELQTVQTEGPYFLGANCGGGLVAFEMAQQLHAQGQTVALLALIDAHAPGCHAPSLDTTSFQFNAYRLSQEIDEHWIYLSRFGLRAELDYIVRVGRWMLRSRLKSVINKLDDKLKIGLKRSFPSSLRGIEEAEPQSISQAIRKYVPTVYQGRLTLFRASKQAAGYDHDPQFGWSRLATKGVDIHLVPGSHGIIQEPRVRILAEKLRACLQKAQKPVPGGPTWA